MNRTKLSLLLAIVTTFSTSLPASAQLSSGDVNIIGIGAGILSGILNPPHRASEIQADAEIKKAKIAADMELEREKLRIAATQSEDKVTPVLKQWGVSRVLCAPGLVFINGIDGLSNTVCLQPTQSISAGYYTYDTNKRQLLRTSSTIEQKTQTAPPAAPAATPPAAPAATPPANPATTAATPTTTKVDDSDKGF
jgi:hypothetical protein